MADPHPATEPTPEAVIAANVRRLRKGLGLSQNELTERAAKVAGYVFGPMAICNIENGKRRVNVDDLLALGVTLGVAPMSLTRPGAGSGQQYEITFEGGISERVVADDCDLGEQWIRFHLQGRPVYVAARARVFGLRINPDGDQS